MLKELTKLTLLKPKELTGLLTNRNEKTSLLEIRLNLRLDQVPITFRSMLIDQSQIQPYQGQLNQVLGALVEWAKELKMEAVSEQTMRLIQTVREEKGILQGLASICRMLTPPRSKDQEVILFMTILKNLVA